MAFAFAMDDDPAIVGLGAEVSRAVSAADTALGVGSGDLPVLGTPVMVALMEGAACRALEGLLPAGTTSVGTHIDVLHLAPSPIGVHVIAYATIVGTHRARVTFEVRAAHEVNGVITEIGRGTHTRVVVDRATFLGDGDGESST
jgi:fluoroacetyl-CoA thioesterase